jgi:hypothetical protein
MDKILSLPILFWKILFLCVQMMNLALFIGSIASDTWFKQKWEIDKSPDYTYHGRLMTTISSFTYCDYGSSYKYCHKECRDWCDDKYPGYSPCKDHCDRYDYWHKGGLAYLLWELGACSTTIASIIIIILCFFKRKYFNFLINLMASTILMFASFILHIIAFAFYVQIVELKFSDSCSHGFDYSGHESVCAKTGPIIALVIMIWLFLLIPVKFLISRKIMIIEKYEDRLLYNQ